MISFGVTTFFLLLLCGYTLSSTCETTDFQILSNNTTPVLTITKSGDLSACPASDGTLENICDTLNRLRIATEFGCSYDCVSNTSIVFPATINQVCYTNGLVACPMTTGSYFCDNSGQCCNLKQIGGYCNDNIQCCSRFCGQSSSCVASCETLGPCTLSSQCCYGYQCNGGVCELTNAVNGGCFVAGTPMTLDNGTVVSVENIQRGDVLASPDGPADVLSILIEQMSNTSVYGFNGETPFFTDAHVFPVFGQENTTSYYSTGSYMTNFIFPYVEQDFVNLANGKPLGRFNYTTGQVSQQLIEEYLHTDYTYNGLAYDVTAWPRTPSTRIPKIYMISDGWITYSRAYFELLIAPVTIAISKMNVLLAQNPAIEQGMTQQCYGLELGLAYGRALAASYVSAFEQLYPNETIPTQPPAGYDGPADEWIEIYKASHTKKTRGFTLSPPSSPSSASSSIDRLRNVKRSYAYSSYLVDWANIGIQHEFTMRTLWLNWLPYSQASQIVDKATDIVNAVLPTLNLYSAITPCLFVGKVQ